MIRDVCIEGIRLVRMGKGLAGQAGNLAGEGAEGAEVCIVRY